MSEQTSIILGANTLAPALATLRAIGFRVRRDRIRGLVAESERLAVYGRSPVELLGLAKLFEIRGVAWMPTKEEVDQFLSLEGIDPAAPASVPSNITEVASLEDRRRSRRRAAKILLIVAIACIGAAYAGSNIGQGITLVCRGGPGVE